MQSSLRHFVATACDPGATPKRYRLGARTRDEIIRELDQCRAAIVWLSRATLTSDYVKTIELPTIFEQQERRGLDLIPVFVDYAPGDEANAAVREIVGREIGDHNGYQLDHDEPFEDEAERIARCYTSAALRQLAGSLPPARPLLRCATRTDAAPGRDEAHVNLDWRVEYPSDGSLPDSDTVDRLQSALARVADETIVAFGAGEIDLALRCHLHLGIAIGHAFRRPSGMVPRLSVDDQEWAAAMLPTNAAPAMERHDGAAGPAGSTRASVEVSLSQNVGPGVDKTVASTGTAYAARIKFAPSTGPAQTSLPDSTTANVWPNRPPTPLPNSEIAPGSPTSISTSPHQSSSPSCWDGD